MAVYIVRMHFAHAYCACITACCIAYRMLVYCVCILACVCICHVGILFMQLVCCMHDGILCMHVGILQTHADIGHVVHA